MGWMPTATLVKGTRTFDTVENRGYALLGEGPAPRHAGGRH